MTLKNPKISFVVPVYNKSAYLSECLESLVNQNMQEIEIVIVDDYSKDSSREIIRYYKDKYPDKINAVYLPKNMGRSYARNYGNKIAKSTIIAVQDADDVALKYRADIIYKNMTSKKLDVFYSSFFITDMFGNVLSCIIAIPFDYERVKRTRVTYIGHSTMAYKKSVINKIKYPDGKWSKLGLDDFALQLKLYHEGYKIGFDTKCTVNYRQLSNSITVIRNAVEVFKLKGEYIKSFEK